MNARTRLVVGIAAVAVPCSCSAPPVGESAVASELRSPAYAAKAEVVPDFGALVPDHPTREGEVSVFLQRVSAGVPWPRGLAWVDGELVVLARGRHRNAGGVDHSIEDRTGCLFRVDPGLAEPVVPGVLASEAVAANAELFVQAVGAPFRLPDRSKEPVADVLMDRPYCTLIHDPVSGNFFVCGYSGVDLPGRKFRKNATDSILRFEPRTGRWYPVELHDPRVVPPEELGYVVSNEYYPHHDPQRSPPPHGWLNGPDGGCVAGDFLYCAAKDNHLVVQYDITGIRADPEAGFPESRPVLGSRVALESPGGTAETELLGPSAVVARGGYLYVGYRTSSVVVRYRLEPSGDLARPVRGELIAVFEPWNAEKKRTANLIDIAFNSRGELFVSCSREGRIWKVGRPDPRRPFFGDDQADRPTTAPPYADLRELTGKKTSCGNIRFDDRDRLYVCAGSYDTASDRIAGVIYRVVERGFYSGGV